MAMQPNSPLARDKMKQALQAFLERLEQHPEKSRAALLQEVELQFDLTPLECEFLNRKLAEGSGQQD